MVDSTPAAPAALAVWPPLSLLPLVVEGGLWPWLWEGSLRVALGMHLAVVVRVLETRGVGCVLVVEQERHNAAAASPRHLLEQV